MTCGHQCSSDQTLLRRMLACCKSCRKGYLIRFSNLGLAYIIAGKEILLWTSNMVLASSHCYRQKNTMKSRSFAVRHHNGYFINSLDLRSEKVGKMFFLPLSSSYLSCSSDAIVDGASSLRSISPAALRNCTAPYPSNFLGLGVSCRCSSRWPRHSSRQPT